MILRMADTDYLWGVPGGPRWGYDDFGTGFAFHQNQMTVGAVEPATPVSAASNAAGDEFVITFSKDMDEDSTTTAGAFIVIAIPGGARFADSIAISGKTVTVGVPAAVGVDSGDRLRVTYRLPSVEAQRLKDAEGGIIMAFTNLEVTNNVP